MSDPLIGRIIGDRYRIEHPIGAGGMGAVYVAVQIHLGRRVALKTLLDATDPRDIERLRTEATAAAALDHPNIVHVTDFVPARGDEPPCIVMELLAGRSLASVLRERGALPVAVALHIGRQMLGALAAAHAAGIVHRDVKPANVVVLDGGGDAPAIKMVDFGIAKLMNDGSRHTTTGTVLGTPQYMAPEQHLALPPTPAVDVWAVGVCLYEMLSGRRPFTGSIDEIVTAVTKGRAPDLANVPREIADVVALALLRDPSARFPDAAAMLAALPAAPVPEASRALAAAPAPAPPRSRARAFVVAMIVTVVAASLVVLAAIELTRHRAEAPVDAQPAPDVVDAGREDDADADADVEEPSMVAASPPSSSAPPESTSSGAPARHPPPGVPCLCTDGWIPLCSEPVFSCTCRNLAGPGMICFADWPGGTCFGSQELSSKTDRSGEPCRGFTRSTSGGQSWTTPAEGQLRCMNGCSWIVVREHPTVAVPGTPCRGFNGAEVRAGKWMKLVPPAKR